MRKRISDAAYRKAAVRLWHDEGRIEIDDTDEPPKATVSRDELVPFAEGAYVLAWIWIGNQDLKPEDQE
jgi:hypothetical protein